MAQTASVTASTPRRKRPRSSRRSGVSWRVWIGRLVGFVIVALAAFLLYRTLGNYSLAEIRDSIASIPTSRLLGAGAFALGSYVCLSFFDFLALRHASHPLPYPKAALASFCSLSLGHNIGFAALSSGAIRYRFYTRWGLSGGDVATVIVFCGLTVGLGLMLTGGAALLARPDLGARTAGIGQTAAMAAGAVCVVLCVAYAVACFLWRKKVTIRSWSVQLPHWKLALAQLVVGPLNFMCVAGCLHQLLLSFDDVAFLQVMAVYVIANTTALLAHVPGGLGVIETAVLYFLPGAQVIGALVMFRVTYFLVPLCIGGALFAATELVLARKSVRFRR